MTPGEGYHKKLRKRIYEVDYLKCLDLCYKSFVHTNPHNKFIVQTDETTNLNYECYRSNISDLNLMESIVASNLNFVRDHIGKSVLVGADHLVVNKIDAFFNEDFDLGFYCQQNYNKEAATNLSNSVVLINSNKTNHKKIVDFFNRRYEIYKNYPPEYKTWWGDQLSLFTLVNEKNIVEEFYNSNQTKRFYDFDGLKIKIFKYDHEYLREVKIRCQYQPNVNDIVLDFPGTSSIKKCAEIIYNRLFSTLDKE